ncbi:hypothetical protein KAS50_05250, partial [bacterium]|nr:hypothetical protein [bacterium]
GSARISVTESEFYDEKGVKVLPVPTPSAGEEMTVDEYIVNAGSYKSDKWIGSAMYSYNEPAFLRRQKIQNILLYPLQYNPSKGDVRICKRMRIEVSFTYNGESSGKEYPDRLFEQVYRNVLLNYEQARGWRKSDTKKLFKTAGQNEGTWYKMTIDNEGIYILDKQFFDSRGINMSGVNPKSIKIYNNGGRELPRDINSPRAQGLMENGIYVYGEGDGSFDDGDFVLFYGKPTFGWGYSGDEPRHYIHHYQDENIYWLTFGGDSKRMAVKKSANDANAVKPEYFKNHVFIENEIYKLYESGTEWYGVEFQKGDTKTMKTPLPGYLAGSPITYTFALKGGTSGQHRFEVSEGSTLIGSKSFYSISESMLENSINADITDNESALVFSYTNSSSVGRGFLDWIEIEYSREFKAEQNELLFRASLAEGTAEYTVSGFGGNDIRVFDVTDFSNVKMIDSLTIQGDKVTFGDTVSSSVQKIYAAVERSAFKTPSAIVLDENSDLRTLDRIVEFIIITHEEFYDEALMLKNFRETNNDLKTEVVKVTDIYDEFSGGVTDPAAIRDFLRFAYENWTDGAGNSPAYVLLVGDGSYDFKQTINKEGRVFIPPLEIDNNNELYTRCTDDWYVYLEGDDRVMDMSIGRLPVSSKAEAQTVIQKFIQYESNPEYGFWKNTITFVADDELTPGDNVQRIHTDQSEILSNAGYMPDVFNQKKIYLMDYPGEVSSTASGIRKPKAQSDFVSQINEGSALISYIGHGSYKVLAHERVLSLTDD